VDSSQLSPDSTPDIAFKCIYLKELLIDKKVGSVLCSKFRLVKNITLLYNYFLLHNYFVNRLYWKPSVIGSHLEQAARFCKSRESTLNISDSVSTYTFAFSGAFLIN